MNSILLVIHKPAQTEIGALTAWQGVITKLQNLPKKGIRQIHDNCWIVEDENGLPFFGQAIAAVTPAQDAAPIKYEVIFFEKTTTWNCPSKQIAQ